MLTVPEPPDHSAAGWSDGTTEFRTTPAQLRHLLIAVVIACGVAVLAGFIAVSAHSARAAQVAAAGGLYAAGLVAVSTFVLVVLAAELTVLVRRRRRIRARFAEEVPAA